MTTTSDKELLELAAKAAGWKLEDFSSVFPSGFNATAFFYKDEKGMAHHWNPLTDDGDALRLAVKLEILVDVCDKYTDATDGRYADICELHHGDKYAATRRAIVRAAAEIGKTL